MVACLSNNLPTIYRIIIKGDIMNIAAMAKDWRTEGQGAVLTKRSLRNIDRGYDQGDVDKMLKEIANGTNISQAAKNNNIPRGSADRLMGRC